MSIAQLLVQIVLSVVAAYVVIWVNASYRKRQWLEILFFCLGLSVLCCFALALNFELTGSKQFDLIPLVLTVSLAGGVTSGIYHWCEKRLSTLRNFESWIHRWSQDRKTTGWEWCKVKHSAQFGVKIGNLPSLDFLGYSNIDFSQLNQNSPLQDQVAVYHIVDSKEYISWVDAVYWRVLRKMADAGIAVSIYILFSNYRDQDKRFDAYVHAILGDTVNYDYNLIDRIEIPTTVQNIESAPSSKALKYDRLAASARILPLFIGCKHSFIFLWEGYYGKIKKALRELPPKLILPVSKSASAQSQIHVDLSDFHGTYVLCPTAIGISDCCKQHLVPGETFLLGNYTYWEVAKRISGLPNHSLRIISNEILSPLLGPIARVILRFSISCLLLLRSHDGSTLFQWSTQLVARAFSVANRTIDRRIKQCLT